jgi:hypothetical protein
MIFATLLACKLVSTPPQGIHRQVKIEPVCKQLKITDIPARDLTDCQVQYVPQIIEEHFSGEWAVKATCNEEHDA